LTPQRIYLHGKIEKTPLQKYRLRRMKMADIAEKGARPKENAHTCIPLLPEWKTHNFVFERISFSEDVRPDRQ